MKAEDFRNTLVSVVKHNFPEGDIIITDRRQITVEARVKILEDVFIEVYYNALTDKKSFALIKKNQRVFGYDNYKYWHVHPMEDIKAHLPCEEPSIEKILEEMKEIILSKK